MIERYKDPKIDELSSDKAKTQRWQDVELAVIEAKTKLGLAPPNVYEEILVLWTKNPIDLEKWYENEKASDHDLAAFIKERKDCLPPELARYVHADNMTSYDTEEPANAIYLLNCLQLVFKQIDVLHHTLRQLAEKHRYTIMNGRTHGQEAELQSFGKRVCTWLRPIQQVKEMMFFIRNKRLNYSRLSGAIGNYSGISPELEKEALEILGLVPYVGATQIMPRSNYMPLISSLVELMGNIANIAIDIRLGARSGRPIYQEPFKKTQVGSSAMPHKKNTIKTENSAGMYIMGSNFATMLQQTMVTWEERAIEQSCVERIAWADLFHVVMYALKTITKVLEGLEVYPDNMYQEIIESRGCYAASHAKEVLVELLTPEGLSSEEVYRIVQLASFNAFEVPKLRLGLRKRLPHSIPHAVTALVTMGIVKPEPIVSIQTTIRGGKLRVFEGLEATADQVKAWNIALKTVFGHQSAIDKWNLIFDPTWLLRNESYIFNEVLGK
jgi:adenylosuccinate lyase